MTKQGSASHLGINIYKWERQEIIFRCECLYMIFKSNIQNVLQYYLR